MNGLAKQIYSKLVNEETFFVWGVNENHDRSSYDYPDNIVVWVGNQLAGPVVDHVCLDIFKQVIGMIVRYLLRLLRHAGWD